MLFNFNAERSAIFAILRSNILFVVFGSFTSLFVTSIKTSIIFIKYFIQTFVSFPGLDSKMFLLTKWYLVNM